ncbi:J domain-containing protein [Candidatus Dependentiae bacterium]|nr:J domain-containing protein [Candidatus Dependentiae bacterium]
MKKFLLTLLLAVPGLYAMQQGQAFTQADVDRCLNELPYGQRKNLIGKINPNTLDQFSTQLPRPHYESFRACLTRQSRRPMLGTEGRGALTASDATTTSNVAPMGTNVSNTNPSGGTKPYINIPNVRPYNPTPEVPMQQPVQQDKPGLISAEDFIAVYKDASPNEVLGTTADSSPEQIRKAYRDLVIKFHPDNNEQAQAGEAFKIVEKAYTSLNPKQ